MDAKYNYPNKDDGNEHYKTKSIVKKEPGTGRRLIDQIVFEEDEFENTGLEKNSKSLLDHVARIKQELDQDGKQEPGLNIRREATDGLELKQEPADHETKKDIEELYADHEVKEEMVVGPVMLLESIPTQTKLNQKPPDSNIQLHCNMQARKTYSSRPTTLKLSNHNKKLAFIGKICKNEYKHQTGSAKPMASHVTVAGVALKTRRQNDSNKNITHHKKSRSVDDATVASQYSETRNHDKSIQKYVCDTCQKVFETKKGIVTHMNKHRSRKSNYFCDICNKCLISRQTLKRHKELHSNKYYTCHICQKAFKQKHGLAQHMDIHNQSSGRNYFCDICNKCLISRQSLKRHKELHSNKYNTCHVCQKAFKQKHCLAQHMDIHNQSSESKYFCDICNKCFSSAWCLKRHKKLHSNIYYTCDICQKAFKQKHRLAQHIDIHNQSSGSNYFCDICNKCFSSAQCLKRHKELHSNKYYTCDICQKSYKHKDYLAKHMNYHNHNSICHL